jgi:glyoxylase-like metal-dependent hydrolase (beta-lactamase superfamily II)
MAASRKGVGTTQTFRIGAVGVHLLSDGIFRTDGGAAWGVVPRVLWERVVQPDALHRIPMQLRCLLIESGDGLILVDTGHGDKLPVKRREQLGLRSEGRLTNSLAELGFVPDDVHIVINTHLHGDHCGGNTAIGDHTKLVPTFPKAIYVVQRLELADATYPNERTRNAYFGENFLPLSNPCEPDNDSVLQVLNGGSRITDDVRTMITPGHTRAHQVVVIESRGETAVFLGDAVGWAVSLERLAWVPAFDVEPLTSMETKRSLREWALRRDALLIFQHDIAVAAGRLQLSGDEWHVEPVSQELEAGARM